MGSEDDLAQICRQHIWQDWLVKVGGVEDQLLQSRWQHTDLQRLIEAFVEA